MKRNIIAIVLVMLVILTGCSSDKAHADRFTEEAVEGYVIITDTETEHQYLFYKGGLTQLLPKVEEEASAIVEAGHPFAEEAKYIAKTIWGEARGCSTTEQAAVAWCILNRVDTQDPYYPDNIISVITQPNQFKGYDPDHPVTEEFYNLALDVIDLWMQEDGEGIVAGRVLPSDYLWFSGDGEVNTFRNSYEAPYDTWDWSLISPYD